MKYKISQLLQNSSCYCASLRTDTTFSMVKVFFYNLKTFSKTANLTLSQLGQRKFNKLYYLKEEKCNC